MAQKIELTNGNGDVCTIEFGDDGFLYIMSNVRGVARASNITGENPEPIDHPTGN